MIFRIVKYVLLDILRGRAVIGYAVFLLAAGFGLFNLGGDVDKGLVSILSLVLMIVPLTTLIFATIHYYNSYEFIELLSTQPLRRHAILLGEYLGVCVALGLAYLVGIGVPVSLYARTASAGCIVLAGLLLTLVFAGLAFLGAVCARDKARGMGVALLVWFFFALIFDGILLYVVVAFQDYPVEKAAIALVAFNPIDLARTFVMLQMDVSALMGMTGAVMRDFFGSAAGIAYTLGVLAVWIVLPVAAATRWFGRKDL